MKNSRKNIQTRIDTRFLAHMLDLMKKYDIDPETNRDGSPAASDLIKTALIWLLEEKIGNPYTQEPSEESLSNLGNEKPQKKDKHSQIRQIIHQDYSESGPEPEKPPEPLPELNIRGITERDQKTLENMLQQLWAGNLREDDILGSQTTRHRVLGAALIKDLDRQGYKANAEVLTMVDQIYSEIWQEDFDGYIIPQIDPNTLADEKTLKKEYPELVHE